MAIFPAKKEVNKGQEMYDLVKELFPICRSITGDGVRETFKIISKHIPVTVHEISSGTKVFDWIVPQEWNIRDAYVADSKGKKIIDFKKNNLHVVGYSIPVDENISREELEKHLFSLPNQPDAIPYITSYYKRQWGFCMTHNERKKLSDDTYRVFIDSELKNGFLTYGEYIMPGKKSKEILISTYICHPSMANNELSGPAVATYLAKFITGTVPEYTYRFVFIPETIGSLVYLSLHLEEMKKNIIAGFNLTCVGDDRSYSLLSSRNGETLADRVALGVLKDMHPEFIRYSYLERGSDERQYCSPGIDLPVVSIMRSKYGSDNYPEYHTSLDNLSLVTPSGLEGAYDVVTECVRRLETRKCYRTTCLGEPQLGRRGLYPNESTKETRSEVKTMMNIIAYSDGTRDIAELSEFLNVPVKEVVRIVQLLEKEGLLAANV